ncbi:MAG: hypothetical protein LH615_13590 [Ferruginibacter sp.]|nr:hypothetical protein [Ferruginibacter sp.]
MLKGAGMEAVARSAASQRRQTRTTSVQPDTNAEYCMGYIAPKKWNKLKCYGFIVTNVPTGI